MTDQEKELIFKHFGYSKSVNEDIYQASAGTCQIKSTGQKLLQKCQVENFSTLLNYQESPIRERLLFLHGVRDFLNGANIDLSTKAA